MTQVLIRNGVYRNKPVHNEVFELVKDFTAGAKGGFVTIDSKGFFGPEYGIARVKVDSIDEIEIMGADATAPAAKSAPAVEATDEEVMARIRGRFEILDEMTKAAVAGDVRAMIVSGPPGVGATALKRLSKLPACLTRSRASVSVQKLLKALLLQLVCIRPCTSTVTRIAFLCLMTATASCLMMSA